MVHIGVGTFLIVLVILILAVITMNRISVFVTSLDFHTALLMIIFIVPVDGSITMLIRIMRVYALYDGSAYYWYSSSYFVYLYYSSYFQEYA